MHWLPEKRPWLGVPLIRVMVGGVFLAEGIQKFLFPQDLGAGRFARIGFPAAEPLAAFVGFVEIACGALVLCGLFARFAALLLVIDMVVAIVTTKVPILLGRGFGPFSVRELERYGFWSMAHESRTDFAMLLGALFLIIAGAGPWSLDHLRARRGRGDPGPKE